MILSEQRIMLQRIIFAISDSVKSVDLGYELFLVIAYIAIHGGGGAQLDLSRTQNTLAPSLFLTNRVDHLQKFISNSLLLSSTFITRTIQSSEIGVFK